MRRVTIFSDASHCAVTGTGGWGCWIKTDGASAVVKGGAFKAPTPGATHAEFLGIVNALSVARNAGWLAGAWVMIQCDSLNALGLVRIALSCADSPAGGGLKVPIPYRKKGLPASFKPAMALLSELIAAEGATVVVRHVRGHQQGAGRQFVNRLVDQAARSAMKAKRRAGAAA